MIAIDLKGKLAVVTGGSGELGRVICRALAKAGADVAIHYFHGSDRAQALTEELCTFGVRAETFCCDVTDWNDVMKMRDEIKSRMGCPDIVVTAAYIPYTPKPLLEQDPQDYVKEYRGCVIHNINMAKAFVPAMQELHWGRFIAINTEQVMTLGETYSAYVSGKRAMDGILRVLAKEVGPYGITVNQIAPSAVKTERNRAMLGNDTEYKNRVPMRARVEDTDIANSVLFLASSLSDGTTGFFLPVTGGRIMPGI